MTKHHWRQQMKSFFERHADPEKHEQLKETGKDMEEKKEKMIKLIKGEEQDESNGKKQSLEELVKDYHKQYESLYEHYLNLTGELKRKVHGNNDDEKEKFSSSSSDADSDMDNSSKGPGHKNGKLHNKTDSLQRELEAANYEIDELRKKLTTVNDEKENLRMELENMTKEIYAENDSRFQLDLASNQKEEMKEQLEIKEREAQVLRDEASRLRDQVSQLEATLKERDVQHSVVLKKLEDIEKESQSKTEALTVQLNSLEREAETMRAQKSELEELLVNKGGEASAQMKELLDRVNEFQKELTTLATLKAEMESELEKKSQEVLGKLTQIERLTEKLESSEVDQKKILEEKQGLAYEVESLNKQKSKLEEDIRRMTTEAAELRVEIAGLKQRNTELEGSVLEKDNECGTLQSKIQDQETEASSKIMALTTEIAHLKEELQVLHAGKTDLESKVEIVSRLENENAELRSKVIDLEFNLRSAERKTEELSRGNQSNDQLIVELETTIEDLKRDIEMDKDELVMIEEKNRNLEVMLRLSNQKLRVTEQLLSEKEASNSLLEARNAALSQTLEEYSGMIRDISEQANASLAGLEYAITKKFDEDHRGLAKRIFAVAEEIRGVKSWVAATRTEKVKRERTFMRERIEQLEAEAREEKVEKEEAARALSRLDRAVREKDERLLGLGEEKREAIRQLCVWTEYHRSRSAELQGVLLKMAPKVRRTAQTP